MLEITTCGKCKDELWQYGELVFNIFESICIEHLKEPFDIPSEEHFEYLSRNSKSIYNIILFLESKGYLVSTESDKSLIRIKPKGLFCQEHNQGKSCHICFHNCKHESY